MPRLRPLTDPGAGPGPGSGEDPVPRLVRPRAGRVIGGVCAGLAEHLGLRVRTVRWAMVLLTALGGLGLLAYVMLWSLTPSAGVEPADDARRRSAGQLVFVGVGLVAVATLLRLGTEGAVGEVLRFAVPFAVVAVGAMVTWSDVDEGTSVAWLGRTRGRSATVRVVAGLVIAMAGMITFLAAGADAALAWRVALASLAVVGGLALLLAPWATRFWRRLQAEQAQRIRETERADIAAHLHDSVLQTLALIQRTDDPARVAGLARAQERELRAWLYGSVGGAHAPEETLAAALAAAVHEIEDRHGVPVDLVTTGDAPLDPAGEALVAAAREATGNAVRHGAPPVAVYVEVGPGRAEVFVRDHGPGFDLDDVPPDRLGVRESILARTRRHGGTARIRRLEEGTEVALDMPLADEPADAGGRPAAPPAGPGPKSPRPTGESA